MGAIGRVQGAAMKMMVLGGVFPWCDGLQTLPSYPWGRALPSHCVTPLAVHGWELSLGADF